MNATVDTISAVQSSVGTENKPAWSAVFSMALGVASLVMAELLPISLLTPMANELGISEGAAGQTVTVTAIVALVFSLFSASLTHHLNRKTVILSFSGLLTISCLMVGFAPNLVVLLAGRLLLGIALGGFWSMATAIAMRLVPGEAVPKALSIIFGAVSISTAISAPLGTYLGALIGWRGTFLAAAGFGVIAIFWQVVSMPSLPPLEQSKLKTLWLVMKRPLFGIGMLSVLLVFGGHQAFLTYLRPFLETVTHMGVSGLSLILLAFGITSFIGTSLAGPLLKGHLRQFLQYAPFLMALFASGLMLFGTNAIPTSIIVAAWGAVFGTVPVAWSTWVAQRVPDEAESAGGLLVANIQLGMAIGAGVGGFLFDAGGSKSLFIGSAVILLLAAILITILLSTKHSKQRI